MRIFLYFTLALFLFTSCRSTKKPKEIKESSFIPYTTGSYWVFKDSEGFVDTLKVLSSEKTAEGLKVDLNSEKWLIKSPDSIFVRCQTRGGGEFTMPLFIKTKATAEYNTCLGDVVTQVDVTRLKEPLVIAGKAYIDCTEYFIKPYSKVIVADRVGPVKYIYLDIDGTIKSERNLLDFKVN
jgi:hypothetical protein